MRDLIKRVGYSLELVEVDWHSSAFAVRQPPVGLAQLFG
jgi:hypothetical protein